MNELTHYFVTDIETDGPDPMRHSMLSFATAVIDQQGNKAGEFEGVMHPRTDRSQDESTMEWWKSQPEAWAAATQNAQAPEMVMKEYSDFVMSFSGYRSFAARPLMFDGLWVDHYLREFANRFVLDVPYWGECIFNTSPLDLGSYTLGVFGKTDANSYNIKIPQEWLGTHKHTHRAIDDARGYAHMLAKLLKIADEMPKHRQDFMSE